MAPTDQIKKGMYVEFRGEPHLVTEASFFSPGKGSAFTRTKLKGLASGKTIDFNFRSGEKVEELELITREMQYLYVDQDQAYFMDPDTFEQQSLPKSLLGKLGEFLKEGNTYQILLEGERAVSLRPPAKVKLLVTESAGAARGNTATSATKSVTVETGAKVSVPLFVKEGDIIAINTETGDYIERVT